MLSKSTLFALEELVELLCYLQTPFGADGIRNCSLYFRIAIPRVEKHELSVQTEKQLTGSS